ncbi:MAG: ribonuclease Z [Flavobacteriaceae bacterium]|nr:ribonuclease Z [Flavobacteriaceae bacterium]
MPFEVTILGCSSATPSADRHPSAQVVNIGGENILIDCGEGTQMQLLKYGVKLGKINFILISHLHGDHFLGLPGLLSTMSLMGRKEPLTLIGPEPLKKFLEDFMLISESRIGFDLEFITSETSESKWLYENLLFRIRCFPLSHRIACTGFLIKERKNLRKIIPAACEKAGVPMSFFKELKLGLDYQEGNEKTIPNDQLTQSPNPSRIYAYCSDTIYDESVVDHIKDVDLLYHEATFMHDLLCRAEITFHTTAKQAGAIAAKAEVKRLAIGHFSSRYKTLEPLLDEAKAEFENTELASEGRVFRL